MKRRTADAQCWTVTLSNWKKQPSEVFHKNTVLKFCNIHGKNTCVKLLRTFILKNICVRLFLNWLYEVIHCLELCFWITFKTTLTQQYYKNTSCFETSALNKIWRICRLYIWPLHLPLPLLIFMWDGAIRVQFLPFSSFWLVLKKFYFWH